MNHREARHFAEYREHIVTALPNGDVHINARIVAKCEGDAKLRARMIAQANAASALCELINARDACGEFIDADDPANAARIERVQAAWRNARAALAKVDA